MNATLANKALSVGKRIGGALRCVPCNGRGRIKAKGEPTKTCQHCLGTGYARNHPTQSRPYGTK